MVEIKNNYYFGGLLLVVALIVGGTVYQLNPTGNYKVCNDGVGWQQQSDGQYKCGDRTFDCSSVRGTKTGKSNYYCDEAVRVEIKTQVETQTQLVTTPCAQLSCPSVNVVKYDYDGTKWICRPDESRCVRFGDMFSQTLR